MDTINREMKNRSMTLLNIYYHYKPSRFGLGMLSKLWLKKRAIKLREIKRILFVDIYV